MLKSCKYCGGIHPRGDNCPSKPARKKELTQANKFRSSRRWRETRTRIVVRDKYLCQVCKQEGRYNHEGLEVHHIVPLEEDYGKRR